MYQFYVTVHARPPGAMSGDAIDVGGLRVRPLAVPREALATTTLPCSFEEACTRLCALEHMFCEPDGSFVWTSPQAQQPWQLDGNLYDRDGRLLFVDVKGTCPADALDRLLAALGWPQTPLMFQLTREAVFLDEDEFRRLAAKGRTEPQA
jgi:hypothetical protein